MTELFELIEKGSSLKEIMQAIDDNAHIITMTQSTSDWSYPVLDQQWNPQSNCNVFLCAAEKGRQDVIEYLLSIGFDPKPDLLSGAYMSLEDHPTMTLFLLGQIPPDDLVGAKGILQTSLSKGYNEVVDFFAAHEILPEGLEMTVAGDVDNHDNDAIA
jgi:hypothetical protein